MAMKMDKLYFRPARAGDLPGILDIEKNFIQGLDYIDTVYYHWLHSNDFKMYVAEDGDEIITSNMGSACQHSPECAFKVTGMPINTEAKGLKVGFGAYYLQPGGYAISAMSGRIKPSHRGSGLIQDLFSYACKSIGSQASEICWCSSYGPFWRKNISTIATERQLNYCVLRNFLVETNGSKLRQAASKIKDIARENLTSTTEVSWVEFKASSYEKRKELLQCITADRKVIFHGFGPMPLSPTVENLDTVFRWNRVYVQRKAKKIASISAGNILPSKGRLRVEITVYGSKCLEELFSHLYQQLQHTIEILKSPNQSLILALVFEQYTCFESKLDQVLEALFGERFRFTEADNRGVLVVSKDSPPSIDAKL